ncbi:hypothetical protein RRF57_000648 [Xylaria bambusicola]|uniref:Uncharacterized protein n=1 Tax=Xylaria bambusicola TaxID=326684 RepID=A0AAN7UG33_9PEZI
MESPIESSLPLWDRLLRALKSFLGWAWHWFLTAKVPLPGLIGVPALLWTLVHHDWLLSGFIGGVDVFADFLVGFVARLRILHSVLREIFSRRIISMLLFRCGLGLRAFGERYIGQGAPQVELDGEDDDGGHGGAGRPVRRGPLIETREGETPHTIGQELSFWWAYIHRITLVLFFSAAVLVSVYMLCKYTGGTSFVCGGPKGRGDYTCLRFDDEAIREVSRIGKKPMNYRFFSDGTRMQFPDR